MSYSNTVYNYLVKNGSVTAKKIEELTGTTCSHGVIRDIRKKYGYDILTFEDRKKVRKTIENGKEIKQTICYREWFLRGFGV